VNTIDIGDLQPGLELGPSRWIEISQQRIDAFAKTTDDHQWIHVDPARAAEGPYGGTIAHGYLTLSLLSSFVFELLPIEGTVVNYGLDRVRFPAPLPAGSRIRARLMLAERTELDNGAQLKIIVTFEREGHEKPVCVAEALFRFLR
jgi:acyl dehydratase